MSIVFDENLDLFCLETANTSYIIGLADHRTFVGHVYYGKRVRGQDLRYLLRTGEAPLFRLGMKESAALFMTHFRQNIRETEWEITGKAVLPCVHRQVSMRLCRRMFPMKLQIRNRSFRDFRPHLTGSILHRH